MIAFDGLTLYRNGIKRYVFTALDIYSKIAFARMYKSKSSKNATDFLKRMHYLLDGKIENIQTDNGSEFARYFREAIEKLNISHYFSRPKTPQDNPFDERFNRTLKEEYYVRHRMSNIRMSNIVDETTEIMVPVPIIWGRASGH